MPTLIAPPGWFLPPSCGSSAALSEPLCLGTPWWQDGVHCWGGLVPHPPVWGLTAFSEGLLPPRLPLSSSGRSTCLRPSAQEQPWPARAVRRLLQAACPARWQFLRCSALLWEGTEDAHPLSPSAVLTQSLAHRRSQETPVDPHGCVKGVSEGVSGYRRLEKEPEVEVKGRRQRQSHPGGSQARGQTMQDVGLTQSPGQAGVEGGQGREGAGAGGRQGQCRLAPPGEGETKPGTWPAGLGNSDWCPWCPQARRGLPPG